MFVLNWNAEPREYNGAERGVDSSIRKEWYFRNDFLCVTISSDLQQPH